MANKLGDIVTYVLPDHTLRPAICTADHGGTPQSLNLAVFVDGTNDYPDACTGALPNGLGVGLRPLWVQNSLHSTTITGGHYTPGTWH